MTTYDVMFDEEILDCGFRSGLWNSPNVRRYGKPERKDVEICKKWIQQNCEERATYNKDMNSYGFKA